MARLKKAVAEVDNDIKEVIDEINETLKRSFLNRYYIDQQLVDLQFLKIKKLSHEKTIKEINDVYLGE